MTEKTHTLVLKNVPASWIDKNDLRKLEFKYDIKWGVFKRFLRTIIPQLAIIIPIMITYAEELSDVVPVWVLPTLIFVSSLITAGDKLMRELRKT